MSMNQIASTMHNIHSIAILTASLFSYSQMSNEEKRNVKANVTFNALFATTFATTTVATGIIGAGITANLLFRGSNDGFFGPALILSMGAGLLSMAVAAPGNLSISYLVSNYLTNKIFSQTQQKLGESSQKICLKTCSDR